MNVCCKDCKKHNECTHPKKISFNVRQNSKNQIKIR